MTWVMIFAIGFVAAFVSAMSGCGSGMITLPSWLLLGYPLPTALACDKVNACVWTLLASKNYLGTASVRWKLLLVMTALGILGSVTAAYLVITIDESVLKPVIGVIILITLVMISISKETAPEKEQASSGDALMGLLGFPLGYYEGFFGAGNGIFTAFTFSKLKGFSLVKSLGYYYAMAFVWSLVAAVVLIKSGFADIPLFACASLGAGLGGHLGSKLGSARGSSFVKRVLVVLGTILGIKLILGF
ncbi:MAG: sulfite exporter TauE/SafE family protein [Desulfomonilia bacterium]